MKSMTGYGAVEAKVNKGSLFIEIKTVNHRFCEINLKQPPKMSALELLIKKYIENKYLRGKVEVFIKETAPLFGQGEFFVNLEIAKKYQSSIKRLKKELKIKCSDNILDYVPIEHIISHKEVVGKYDKLWTQVKNMLAKACNQVDKMRDKEGAYLYKDQKNRILKVKQIIEGIKRSSQKAFKNNEKKVRNKVKKMAGFDEQRFLTEVAYLGSRQDITEEVVRMASHVDQYKKLLDSKGAVGRKLDFLLQETNREINTIGAKAGDVTISKLVVDCKSELERLREQVQNIE